MKPASARPSSKAPLVESTDVARSLSLDKGAASRMLKTPAESGFAVQGAD